MMRYGKAYGGEDPQMIEGDVFRIIVKVPEYGAVEKPAEQKEPEQVHQQGGPARAQSGAQSGAQSQKILQALAQESLSAVSLAERLGLHSKTGSFKRTLAELLDKELVAYTIPEKPNSRLQKYRLTQKGLKYIDKLK
jgi:ATP-dependent DNA helicase RecG